MRIFNVLVPDGRETKESLKPIFVEESFSFASFVFQGLWFLYHRLWILGISLILIDVGLSSLSGMFSDGAIYSLKISVAFFAAMFAKTYYIESLKRKNYTLACVIAEKDLDAAKLRFYKENFGEI